MNQFFAFQCPVSLISKSVSCSVYLIGIGFVTSLIVKSFHVWKQTNFPKCVLLYYCRLYIFQSRVADVSKRERRIYGVRNVTGLKHIQYIKCAAEILMVIF